ncbi:response regulator transcription factor [Paenibacillus sp. JDR-2]|uniref:response regulator transcription factor n=1 Tax=Paenibacillus sp. (strain JDR-2) TaxID=324057 RepID=UPI0001663C6A|nr:response regulator [Paenibacillus sp. JDR-2]ACT02707.1 two component transcriptional regulator, AraC family [Paenibacillus sp. JDR-2]
MLSLLIVDDEVYIARKIQASVNWEDLGIFEICLAHNIRQAKEIIESRQIDIVICDIEMPQGTGIDLLAWVREKELPIAFIYLTCHSEFEYTKKAIQLGSLDYLLKPVQSEELRSVVAGAAKKIDKEKPLYAEQFWQELLQQRISSSPSNLYPLIHKRQLPYSENTRMMPVLIGIHQWEKKLSPLDENRLEYAIRKAAEEIVLTDRSGMILHVKRGTLLLLLSECPIRGTEITELGSKLQLFIHESAKYFYCKLSCYPGRFVSVPEILGLYEKLADNHWNNVSRWMRVLPFKEQQECQLDLPGPPMNVWSEMLKQGDKSGLQDDIARLVESWRSVEGLDVKRLEQFYQSFMQMFLFTTQQQGLPAEGRFLPLLSPERARKATSSLEDVEAWAKELVEEALGMVIDEDEQQLLIDKIKRYITLHIDQGLSRQYIADHVGLSPGYVAKLFKKAAGLSVSDYIVEEKMRIAKELLAKSDMTVSSVALAVGFSNFAYFSAIFKKKVGSTPVDYRRNTGLYRNPIER